MEYERLTHNSQVDGTCHSARDTYRVQDVPIDSARCGPCTRPLDLHSAPRHNGLARAQAAPACVHVHSLLTMCHEFSANSCVSDCFEVQQCGTLA